jgi:antitoxin MazE
MSMNIRSKVVKIGNSRGIRIPRTLLEQAGLTDDVEMRVEGNKLPRQGGEAQFTAMAEHGDDRLLDQAPSTQWEEDEWTW